MFHTFLFDLDGTLVPMDTDLFTRAYMGELGRKFAGQFNSEKLAKYIWYGTSKMIEDIDPEHTNQSVFWSHFLPLVGGSAETLVPAFEDFYLNDFPALARVTKPNTLACSVMEQLFKHGHKVAIVTNPIFPEMAIRERMRWVGIDDFPYSLVTTYENMHYCKPRIEYYQEVLDRLEVEPEGCLMIGNDVEEDLIARKLGIKTYLVDDCLLNTKNLPIETDYRGSFADLAEFLQDVTVNDRKLSRSVSACSWRS